MAVTNTTKDLSSKKIIKSVNTTNPLSLTDEDRRAVRSDVGNKMATISEQNKPAKTLLPTDPDLRRWYDNLARGSQLTADVRLRRMVHFCRKHNTTPAELANMQKLLQSWANEILSRR